MRALTPRVQVGSPCLKAGSLVKLVDAVGPAFPAGGLSLAAVGSWIACAGAGVVPMHDILNEWMTLRRWVFIIVVALIGHYLEGHRDFSWLVAPLIGLTNRLYEMLSNLDVTRIAWVYLEGVWGYLSVHASRTFNFSMRWDIWYLYPTNLIASALGAVAFFFAIGPLFVWLPLVVIFVPFQLLWEGKFVVAILAIVLGLVTFVVTAQALEKRRPYRGDQSATAVILAPFITAALAFGLKWILLALIVLVSKALAGIGLIVFVAKVLYRAQKLDRIFG